MTAAVQKIADDALALPRKGREYVLDRLILSFRPQGVKVSNKKWIQEWKTEVRKYGENLQFTHMQFEHVLASLKAKYA